MNKRWIDNNDKDITDVVEYEFHKAFCESKCYLYKDELERYKDKILSLDEYLYKVIKVSDSSTPKLWVLKAYNYIDNNMDTGAIVIERCWLDGIDLPQCQVESVDKWKNNSDYISNLIK